MAKELDPEKIRGDKRPRATASKEAVELALHGNELNKTIIAIENQKIILRRRVCIGAAVVIVVFAILEATILLYITYSPEYAKDFVVLATTPIIAMTTILVAILIGVFRVFRVNADSLGTAAQIAGGAGEFT